MDSIQIVTILLSSVVSICSIYAFVVSRKKDSNDAAVSMRDIQHAVNDISKDTKEIKDKIGSLENRIQIEHDINIKHDTDIKALWRRHDELKERLLK